MWVNECMCVRLCVCMWLGVIVLIREVEIYCAISHTCALTRTHQNADTRTRSITHVWKKAVVVWGTFPKRGLCLTFKKQVDKGEHRLETNRRGKTRAFLLERCLCLTCVLKRCLCLSWHLLISPWRVWPPTATGSCFVIIVPIFNSHRDRFLPKNLHTHACTRTHTRTRTCTHTHQ